MDNKQNTGGQDRSRISTEQRYEMDYWSGKFNVSHDELEAAVKAVGNSADKVEEYLKGNR
jgi:hypothetical protein